MDVALSAEWFQGALSVERVGGGFHPWRLPHDRAHLFHDDLMIRAARTSGVRLRFETDASALTLMFAPLEAPDAVIPQGHAFDVVVENEIVCAVRAGAGDTAAHFEDLGRGPRTLEVWLPPSAAVTVTGLRAEGATFARPAADPRPLWVTWGSSITHCVRAGSAARTWPATVARRLNLNVLSLGFGGQCHLDPTVAMVIRDQPAAYISLKLGINTIGGSVNARTYPALVAGAVAIIREKHPDTPLALVSPIAHPPAEETPSPTGYTLRAMRRDMEEVYRRFVEAGDRNLHYVSGLEVFDDAEIRAYSTDLLHPNAEGMDIQAAHFAERVMPLLVGRA